MTAIKDLKKGDPFKTKTGKRTYTVIDTVYSTAQAGLSVRLSVERTGRRQPDKPYHRRYLCRHLFCGKGTEQPAEGDHGHPGRMHGTLFLSSRADAYSR
jgi:hypothetical protein